jgi:hypothetical protein
MSSSSAVGITTGYGLDKRGFEVQVPVGSRVLTSPYNPDRPWSPPNLLSNGYRGLFPRGKTAGREAGYSPSSSAKVKKSVGPYIHSPIHLHGVVLN